MDNKAFWDEKDPSIIVQDLSESFYFENIIYDLMTLGIVGEDDVKNFLNLSHPQGIKAQMFVQFFLLKPKEREEVDLEEIARVFLKYGHRRSAKHINPEFYANYSSRDPSCEFSDSLHTIPHIPASASLPALSELPQLPPAGFSEFPSLPNISKSLEISVKPAEHIFGGKNSDEIYKHESCPRGLVYMLNIREFEDNKYNIRTGSEVDVKNLTQLFLQMGYDVEPHENLTRKGLMITLNDFTSNERLNKVDSCIVVVMTHGTCDRKIITHDNLTVQDTDIIDMFNNVYCPQLREKPKIFIFQCCRGKNPDHGVSPLPENVGFTRGSTMESGCMQSDGASLGTTIQLSNSNTYSDMICIFATMEGYVAYLNTSNGSWLVQSICEVFMNHAWNTDLNALLQKVIKKFKYSFTDDGKKQLPEVRNLGFDKHLYFNPMPLWEMSQESDPMSSSSFSNRSITPPHQRRHRQWESQSRPTSPALLNYDLQHSGSGSQIRSRHSSGQSSSFGFGNGFMLPSADVLSVGGGLGAAEVRRNSFAGFGGHNTLVERDLENMSLGDEGQDIPPGSVDVVDTQKKPLGPYFQGTSEDFRKWRLMNGQQYPNVEKPAFKRQLSTPNHTEAMTGVHKVGEYLQVHELDEFAENLELIKEAILKNKNKNKRRRNDETMSLDY